MGREAGVSLFEVLIALCLMSSGLLLSLNEGLHCQRMVLLSHKKMQALQRTYNHQEEWNV